MAFLDQKKAGVPWGTLLQGGMVGALEAVMTYPTEYVKTHLQLQSKTQPEYAGIRDCVAKTWRRYGPLGFYRGLGPLVVGSIPKQGVRWFAFDSASRLLKDEHGALSMGRRSVAGFLAGSAEALLAVVPMETVKTKLIDDRKRAAPQFRSATDCLVKTVRHEGAGGLYKGVIATTLKQGLNQATRFPVQHFLLLQMTGGEADRVKSPLYNGLAGVGAGAVSVLVTQPTDVIKTRMQALQKAVAGAPKQNFYSVARDILRTDGAAFFYAGTGPRMLRVCLDVGECRCWIGPPNPRPLDSSQA